MHEQLRRALVAAVGDAECFVVGGAVRDRLLGRPVLDVDLVLADAVGAARRVQRALGGSVFALSDRHGAWRVVLADETTVDTSPLVRGLEADLARRDFTVNAIAEPLAGGALLDPHGGERDLAAGVLRQVSATAFRDDPVRLLRAVRFEHELGLRLEPASEAAVRRDSRLVATAAGERVLAELERLPPDGYRRLDELGLLAPLGGSLERLERAGDRPSPEVLLVAVFGQALDRLPVPNELRRLRRAAAIAPPTGEPDARALHRYRRRTEPWAAEALVLAGRADLLPALAAARGADPDEPLLRGDELGLPPGPEIGRLLERIAEERAAGTIATPEEARALVEELRGDP